MKTHFCKNIETYTLSQALELPFISPVKQWFKEKELNTASEKEKVQAILKYVEDDDIAGLLHFDTEEKAEKYKQDTISEIKRIEKIR